MTLGQQAIKKAVEQAARETALRMLEDKFDIRTISRVTRLTIEEIKVLAKNKHH